MAILLKVYLLWYNRESEDIHEKKNWWIKNKNAAFFQQLTAKWKKKQANKNTDKKVASSNKLKRVGSIFAKVLSGFKIVFNTLFILGFIGGLFGAGVAMGYGVALFDKAQVPQAEELVKQVKDIASISEITYSDGSTIASIEVICCALQSLQMLSQITLRKPLLRQRTNISMSTRELYLRPLFVRPWEPLSV